MDNVSISLTVFFQDPFWIAVGERIFENSLRVCKITFGSEPRDFEVYEYLLSNWYRITFSPPVEGGRLVKTQVNPKRRNREARRQTECQGIGTKSQQALKLAQEQGRQKRKEKSRQAAQEEKERRFELHQQKLKQKHKGR